MRAILIVDDDASIRFAMADYFNAKGYRAESVESREEAEARLLEGCYAVVITDLCLTPFDDVAGLEIVRLIAQQYSQTSCVVLTAYGSPDSEAHARRYGAHAFLHKPQPMAKLLDIVEGLLARGDGCSVDAVARSPSVTQVLTLRHAPEPKEPSMPYQTSDEIVDLIWQDLERQVERPRVAEVANTVAAEIGEVQITTYFPLFVRRLSVERLLPEARRPA